MKKVNFIVGILFFALSIANAQDLKQASPAPPLVDPITNCALRYYYYPNLQAYFDTKTNMYLYCDKGVWIKAKDIPTGYMGYSLYNKVSVFITDYDDDNITQFIQDHKKQFPYVNHSKARIAAMSSRK